VSPMTTVLSGVTGPPHSDTRTITSATRIPIGRVLGERTAAKVAPQIEVLSLIRAPSAKFPVRARGRHRLARRGHRGSLARRAESPCVRCRCRISK
jgi:hypothetical protein